MRIAAHRTKWAGRRLDVEIKRITLEVSLILDLLNSEFHD